MSSVSGTFYLLFTAKVMYLLFIMVIFGMDKYFIYIYIVSLLYWSCSIFVYLIKRWCMVALDHLAWNISIKNDGLKIRLVSVSADTQGFTVGIGREKMLSQRNCVPDVLCTALVLSSSFVVFFLFDSLIRDLPSSPSHIHVCTAHHANWAVWHAESHT